MTPVLVVGAGKIGQSICRLLHNCGDYALRVIDRDAHALQTLQHEMPTLRTFCLPLQQPQPGKVSVPQWTQALHAVEAVVNAGPFQLSIPLARAACAASTHYLDLTEDVASTRAIQQLAKHAACALIPQCGLAPGFVGIATRHLVRTFDSLHRVTMRVGALPRFPSNALHYNLTWSTAGLLNEYVQPCHAIVDGKTCEVAALEGLEQLHLDGVEYEAFNTSGGLGSLSETLSGQVQHLQYRSIRYPGHHAAMKLLLHDLRLAEHPERLQDILEQALPMTYQDVVIVYITVTGQRAGRFEERVFVRKLYGSSNANVTHSAIQLATASSVCAVLDLLLAGQLPQQGFIRQEDIPLDAFLANRFGRFYANHTDATSDTPGIQTGNHT